MLKKKNPKTPSDYSTLRVRLPSDFDIEALMLRVDSVRTHLNKHKPDERKMWMYNHVILEALEIGLNDLKKRKSNLRGF